jgi:hypothetical protein
MNSCKLLKIVFATFIGNMSDEPVLQKFISFAEKNLLLGKFQPTKDKNAIP